MSCGVKFAKFMLIFFNTLFFLTGACLLGIGLWVRLDEDIWERLEVVDVDGEDPMFEYGAYIVIAIGAFILITGFLGCCGAIRESACLLGLYIAVLVLVLLVEVAVGVLLLIYRDTVEDEVIDELKDSFSDEWRYDGTSDKWSAFAKTMNLVQREFDCCGIDDKSDYDAVDPSNKINRNTAPRLCGVEELPASCFKVKDGSKNVDHDKLTCSNVQFTKGPYLEGCKDEIIDFFEKYAVILIAIALGFACLQIFGLIFAICLCRIGGKGE